MKIIKKKIFFFSENKKKPRQINKQTKILCNIIYLFPFQGKIFYRMLKSSVYICVCVCVINLILNEKVLILNYTITKKNKQTDSESE